ncbi:MAG: M20/M25/M40 family metallo-hydrolase [Gemmatimonadota bacterium]|nr:M20/M25/M40 family metallo-hydrolase [Gemmatimonadota bacterium]
MLSILADDSLEGRGTGTRGSAKAARYIADEMRRAGLREGGDSGYFQRVPLALASTPSGGRRAVLLGGWAERDSLPPDRRLTGVNVVGILDGSDETIRSQVVLVDAHYDHLGIGPAIGGDSIYNGADDDASGTVGVLQIARALATGSGTRRTIVFLATTGEEVGLLGTRWYVGHPALPLERTVANLEIEMIAHPDSLAGGSGRGWLTGYERSTTGDLLRNASVAIVPDPRPEQRFFERSDNIAFAMRGIPAHTLSSFNLMTPYHSPSDEVRIADIGHMTAVIRSAVLATRLLADGPVPAWKPRMRPAASPLR